MPGDTDTTIVRCPPLDGRAMRPMGASPQTVKSDPLRAAKHGAARAGVFPNLFSAGTNRAGCQ